MGKHTPGAQKSIANKEVTIKNTFTVFVKADQQQQHVQGLVPKASSRASPQSY